MPPKKRARNSSWLRFSNCGLLLALALPAAAESVGQKLTQLGQTGKCPRCQLAAANLRYWMLAQANLEQANLSGSDLAFANLVEARLANANLEGADLTGADLRKADLSGANLSRTVLAGAQLQGANLRNARLPDAVLNQANLRDTQLSGTNLCRATLPDGQQSLVGCPTFTGQLTQP
jgi:uncharacterized protein YjbI with pentapeptide repeats